jgi:hypothetical protein
MQKMDGISVRKSFSTARLSYFVLQLIQPKAFGGRCTISIK